LGRERETRERETRERDRKGMSVGERETRETRERDRKGMSVGERETRETRERPGWARITDLAKPRLLLEGTDIGRRRRRTLGRG